MLRQQQDVVVVVFFLSLADKRTYHAVSHTRVSFFILLIIYFLCIDMSGVVPYIQYINIVNNLELTYTKCMGICKVLFTAA